MFKLHYACNNHSGEASSPSIQLHRLAASWLKNRQGWKSFIHQADYACILHCDAKIIAHNLPVERPDIDAYIPACCSLSAATGFAA